jgi:hypothetical protein
MGGKKVEKVVVNGEVEPTLTNGDHQEKEEETTIEGHES